MTFTSVFLCLSLEIGLDLVYFIKKKRNNRTEEIVFKSVMIAFQWSNFFWNSSTKTPDF